LIVGTGGKIKKNFENFIIVVNAFQALVQSLKTVGKKRGEMVCFFDAN